MNDQVAASPVAPRSPAAPQSPVAPPLSSCALSA